MIFKSKQDTPLLNTTTQHLLKKPLMKCMNMAMKVSNLLSNSRVKRKAEEEDLDVMTNASIVVALVIGLINVVNPEEIMIEEEEEEEEDQDLEATKEENLEMILEDMVEVAQVVVEAITEEIHMGEEIMEEEEITEEMTVETTTGEEKEDTENTDISLKL